MDKIELIRPDDLLNLRVELENLKLDRGDPQVPALVVDQPDQPAFLRFVFPPQTIVENAYFESANVAPEKADPNLNSTPPRTDPDGGQEKAGGSSIVEPLDPPGTHQLPRKRVAKLAHPSRLVFSVPAGSRIPFSIRGLLDWSKLTPSINPIAAIGRTPSAAEIAAAPAIRAPLANETALELPFRLSISPTGDGVWEHSAKPVTHAGRTELWHTRLELKQTLTLSQAAAVVPPDRLQALEPRFAALKTLTLNTELSRTNTASLRAFWSSDYHAAGRVSPLPVDADMPRTAMAPDDRHQIVVLTSAFHGYETDATVTFMKAGGASAQFFKQTSLASRSPVTNSRSSVRLQQQASLSSALRFKHSYVPQPFEAEQLMLSPLGGWLRSRGHWAPPHGPVPAPVRVARDYAKLFAGLAAASPRGAKNKLRVENLELRPEAVFAGLDFSTLALKQQTQVAQLDLSEWVHHAAQGRDHYVRIVYEGELWPFRHKAALVKVTERKFVEVDPNSGEHHLGAYLLQRMFIVVRQPEVAFADGENRGSPFRQVRLTTLVTPDIAEPQAIAGTSRSFWVDVTSGGAAEHFRFHAVATDKAGDPVDFTIPLMFVSISDDPDHAPATAAIVAQAYNGTTAAEVEARVAKLFGHKLAFAPPDPAAPNENTHLATDLLSFRIDVPGAPAKLLKAEVHIPQVQELLGTDAATTIRYYDPYIAGDFDQKSGVFAEIIRQTGSTAELLLPAAAETLGVDFSADKAGGFATPNLGVSTLTRKLGPLAGKVEDAVLDQFKPDQFFPKDGLAKLFGSFDLADLLPVGDLGSAAPKLKTTTAGGKVSTALDWKPEVKNLDLGIAAFEKDQGGTSALEIHGLIEKPFGGGAAPTADFNGKLDNFRVIVLKSVFVNFVSFAFAARNGQKPDVKVALDPATPLEFAGDLKFVEELRKAIPPGLFGDGPSLDVSPTGIRAGFAFALPPIAVGVFALKDVSLGAALTLPFLDGKPSFDFNVSERAHPFQLTVSLFGGGGFFHLQIDTAGIRLLEAAFEFGAAAAIDIGVASGEVHIMAGVYFSMQRKENNHDLSCTLSGYLRLGGSLSVLGLIHVSVEFNLSFTYREKDKAYGTATLTVHVEVLFFSKDVSLTVERQFSGSSSDPKFIEMYDDPARWNAYAAAFA